MAEADDSFTLVAERATKAAPKGTKRAERQLQRHGPKPPIRHNCRHAKGVYRCGEITDEDLHAFNLHFYSHTKKIDQDNFVLKYLVIMKKKTRRQRNQGHTRVRNECETSFFASKSSKETVRVCKDFFLKALAIGRKRVDNIAKSFHRTSTFRKENRGGDRKEEKFQPKRRAVKTFIKSLIGRESHYSRSKSCKIYLPPELKSIKHLWNLYKTTNPNIPVKYEFFRRIFHRDFRIGFGSPKTDACSMCERLRNEIKNEADQIKKQNLMTQLTVHKRRANVFYDLLNEKRDGLKVLCFDHQQNQVLPKVPDQQAYYSRQLYVYNFTIVETKKDGALGLENVNVYTWKENEYAKNSSSCSSAVFNALKHTSMEDIDTVRLVSDACGGQNKNSALIYMAGYWLTQFAPPNVKMVELLFPVRGHTFLPCDRVFGVLEKKIRRIERIYNPDEYHNIFQETGKLYEVSKDWPVYNFKAVSDLCFKRPLPIKIQESKRFFLTRSKKNTVKVQAEANFRNMLNNPEIITKKGHGFTRVPQRVHMGVPVNAAKKSDIRKLLLEHACEGWEADARFSFLLSVVSESEHSTTDASSSHHPAEDCECDCLSEDPPADRI